MEKTSTEGPERLLWLFRPEAITVTETSLTNECQQVKEPHCNTYIIVASHKGNKAMVIIKERIFEVLVSPIY